MSDSEMQRIDQPTIYSLWSAFLSACPAGYLPYRRKEFIGQSQQNCFVYFIEAIIGGR
jgi:hypothetical protein